VNQNPTNTTPPGDEEALGELGRRLAGVRLERNWTQGFLATEAGVSRATVRRLESGHSTQLTNLLRILRALGLAGNLEGLVPQPEVRPLDALEREGRRRRRASGKRLNPESDATDQAWSWGDEGDRP
jgi:transcriptional regulator with XRE-family HTH domain